MDLELIRHRCRHARRRLLPVTGDRWQPSRVPRNVGDRKSIAACTWRIEPFEESAHQFAASDLAATSAKLAGRRHRRLLFHRRAFLSTQKTNGIHPSTVRIMTAKETSEDTVRCVPCTRLMWIVLPRTNSNDISGSKVIATKSKRHGFGRGYFDLTSVGLYGLMGSCSMAIFVTGGPRRAGHRGSPRQALAVQLTASNKVLADCAENVLNRPCLAPAFVCQLPF